jgi:hypothetical protein
MMITDKMASTPVLQVWWVTGFLLLSQLPGLHNFLEKTYLINILNI